jgi:hypothetical protein
MMDVNKALEFAERLIFARTGKHMNDVQRTIFEGSWQGKTYKEIHQSSPGRSTLKHKERNVAPKLWKLLSEELGEEVTKDNLQGAMKRGLEKRSHPSRSAQQSQKTVASKEANVPPNTPSSTGKILEALIGSLPPEISNLLSHDIAMDMPTYKIGQTVSLKDIDLRVVGVDHLGKRFTATKYHEVEALGNWVAVSIDITNTGNTTTSSLSLNSNRFLLKASDGKTYAVSPNGTVYYSKFVAGGEASGILPELTQLPPSVTARFHLLFDVTPETGELKLTVNPVLFDVTSGTGLFKAMVNSEKAVDKTAAIIDLS